MNERTSFLWVYRDVIERSASTAIRLRNLEADVEQNHLVQLVRLYVTNASESRFHEIRMSPVQELQKIAGDQADEVRDPPSEESHQKRLSPRTRADVARMMEERRSPRVLDQLSREDDLFKKTQFVKELQTMTANDRLRLAVRAHNPRLKLGDKERFAIVRLLNLEPQLDLLKAEAERIAALPSREKAKHRSSEWRFIRDLRQRLNGVVAGLSDAELTRLGLRVIVAGIPLFVKITLIATMLCLAASPAMAGMVH